MSINFIYKLQKELDFNQIIDSKYYKMDTLT